MSKGQPCAEAAGTKAPNSKTTSPQGQGGVRREIAGRPEVLAAQIITELRKNVDYS